MISLDIDFLFTNIPLDKTIETCINTFFENTESATGLSKIEFKVILSIAAKELYITFNENTASKLMGWLWFHF